MGKREVLIQPPKLDPVFGVAIAGHREGRLHKNWYDGADKEKRQKNLQNLLHLALQKIQDLVATSFDSVDQIYSQQKPRYNLITGQAYGVEEMTESIAKELGFEINHLIATKANIVLQDNEYGVQMGMKPPKGEELKNSDFKLRDGIALGFSDLLVAVLDDRDRQRLSSGTAVMVAQALKQRKPVLLLHLQSDSDTPAIYLSDPLKLTDAWLTEVTALGMSTDLIFSVMQRYEDLDSASGALKQWVEAILLPFKPALNSDTKENRLLQRIKKQKSLSGYIAHRIRYLFNKKNTPKPLGVIEWIKGSVLWVKIMLNPPYKSQALQIQECLRTQVLSFTLYENMLNRVHNFFSNIAKLKFRQAIHAARAGGKANRYEQSVKPSKEIKGKDPIKEPEFEKVFNWSDAQAKVFSRRYRDDTWVIYYAAAFAVFCAVAGAIHLWPAPKEGIPFIWVFLEFILLHFIVRRVLKARFSDYHGRWMNFRFIAEQIRYLRLGFPLLVLPNSFSTPVWEPQNKKMVLISAETWILQRVLVAQGLPKDSSGDRLYKMTEHNKVVLDYVNQVLQEHKSYYHSSYHNLHKDHIYLHRLAFGLFTLTFLAVTVHFFYNLPWILIFTAFFPAWGAAIHGILSQNEVVRVSSMASQAWRELNTLLEAFAMHEKIVFGSDKEIANGWQQTMEIRKLIVASTKILSDENQYWRSLFQHNHPELPA